ncbi:uncharacterized protein C8Q71DRAFT_861384 [Rhodofomes roseus]|uniref:Uncharacterized protein n=1 Tax=Rhodofomes roseus TaxID=34475 RepID=A0ABQ8K5A5_9APHY|nr:uncharacterized protein C8Q71DRAFT_861384 [Rhodofomes roseus]KAH9832102.1 hypothetical protein C8Q71DRAFT_861384 [Rhodofomes roseus]
MDVTREWLRIAHCDLSARQDSFILNTLPCSHFTKLPRRTQIDIAVTAGLVDLIFNPLPRGSSSQPPYLSPRPTAPASPARYPETLYLELREGRGGLRGFVHAPAALSVVRPAGPRAPRPRRSAQAQEGDLGGRAHAPRALLPPAHGYGRAGEAETKRWKMEMEDVVLQPAASPSVAKSSAPDAQLTKLATSWAESNLRAGSSLSTLMRGGAASICASVRGDCAEVEVDNFDKVFAFLRPAIQGGAEICTCLSEDELQQALDFCMHLVDPTTPEQHESVRRTLAGLSSSPFSAAADRPEALLDVCADWRSIEAGEATLLPTCSSTGTPAWMRATASWACPRARHTDRILSELRTPGAPPPVALRRRIVCADIPGGDLVRVWTSLRVPPSTCTAPTWTPHYCATPHSCPKGRRAVLASGAHAIIWNTPSATRINKLWLLGECIDDLRFVVTLYVFRVSA